MITFVLYNSDPKKHSTRFDYRRGTLTSAGVGQDDAKFNPSFYVPKPYFANAKAVKVTIEEVE